MEIKQNSAAINKQLGYIDALRGVAILGVIFVHSALVTQQTGHVFELAFTGQRGVQLFYMVSAFTLCLSLDSPRKEQHLHSNFFIRRFFRIAPLFYTIILANLLLNIWKPYYSPLHGLSWHELVLGFLFLNGISPKAINAVVAGGWSIAVETTFYLLLPLLHRYFKTVRSTLLLFAISALSLGLLSSRLASAFTVADWVDKQYFAFLWFPVEFPVFVLGILSYCTWKLHIRGRVLERKKELSLLLIFASFMFFWGCLPFSDKRLYPSSLVFALLLIALSIHPWAILVNPFTRFIGKISYSLYLLQGFALLFAAWLMSRLDRSPLHPLSGYISHGPAGLAVAFLLIFGISVPFSMLSWKFIEQPGIRLGRRWISYREGRTAATGLVPDLSELRSTGNSQDAQF